MRGDTEAVQLLIDRGADVNGSNKDGSTALHGEPSWAEPAPRNC